MWSSNTKPPQTWYFRCHQGPQTNQAVDYRGNSQPYRLKMKNPSDNISHVRMAATTMNGVGLYICLFCYFMGLRHRSAVVVGGFIPQATKEHRGDPAQDTTTVYPRIHNTITSNYVPSRQARHSMFLSWLKVRGPLHTSHFKPYPTSKSAPAASLRNFSAPFSRDARFGVLLFNPLMLLPLLKLLSVPPLLPKSVAYEIEDKPRPQGSGDGSGVTNTVLDTCE